jgi:hypothetical protein
MLISNLKTDFEFFSLLELERVLKLHFLMHKQFFLGIIKIIIVFHFIMKDGLKYAIKTFRSKKKFSNSAKFKLKKHIFLAGSKNTSIKIPRTFF